VVSSIYSTKPPIALMRSESVRAGSRNLEDLYGIRFLVFTTLVLILANIVGRDVDSFRTSSGVDVKDCGTISG